MNPLRISVRSNKGIVIIGHKEIMYCMADGRYTRIFLENGESYLIAKVLRNYEILLPGDTFCRIHKSCIVNLAFIKEYSISKSKQLLLVNNQALPVAKRRYKYFLEKLLRIYPS